MAHVLNTSPSFSSVSYDHSYSISPSNYTLNQSDYAEEGIKRAFIDLLKLTIPITITSLFVSILPALNLIWIGHYSSEDEFAGAALGNMIVNILGNSIIIGMTSGLDTQCGQAFGARLYGLMGLFVQRSILISHIIITCISVIFWFSEDLLFAFGQNKNASHNAAIFVRIFIAALWPIAMFGNLRRYLQAQRQVIFIPMAVLIGLFVQIVCFIVFAHLLKFEFLAACIALPASYWFMFIALYLFTKCNHNLRRAVDATWPKWNRYALSDWFIFLKLSVFGTFNLAAEWWSLEILTLFAGEFGNKYVCAFCITLNIIGVLSRLPLGISFSAAVLVGNKLGAHRPVSAKIIYDCSIALSIMSGLFLSGCLWIFAEPISKVYTDDGDIQRMVAETLPYCAVYFSFYSYQRGSSGGARGMNRQNMNMRVYVIGYYVIGLPLGLWFAYNGFIGGNGDALHIKGLWIGATISAMIGSFFFLFFRFCINWYSECVRAQRKIESDQYKMREFEEEMIRKYADLIGDDVLITGNGDANNELGHHQINSTNINNEHAIFDEVEPDWDTNRSPHNIKYHGYDAPEMSQTHTVNSMHSRSHILRSSKYSEDQSVIGANKQNIDASLRNSESFGDPNKHSFV